MNEKAAFTRKQRHSIIINITINVVALFVLTFVSQNNIKDILHGIV